MADYGEHALRLKNPPADVMRKVEQQFVAEHTRRFEERADYYRHRHLVEDDLYGRLFDPHRIDDRVKSSLTALRESWPSRVAELKPMTFAGAAGPPVFQMHAGLNVISPPYDLTLKVALGSQQPSVQASAASGVFGVVASASSGKNTFGSAGIVIFIAPSDPARTLTIRPFFQWDYSFSCESHGPPTAHSIGVISTDVSGHRSGGVQSFPGRSAQLWSAGSDAWDDASGADADVFRADDAQLTVSGADFYTLNYVCQVSGDSHTAGWWWSASFTRLHCRVPFIAIREF